MKYYQPLLGMLLALSAVTSAAPVPVVGPYIQESAFERRDQDVRETLIPNRDDTMDAIDFAELSKRSWGWLSKAAGYMSRGGSRAAKNVAPTLSRSPTLGKVGLTRSVSLGRNANYGRGAGNLERSASFGSVQSGKSNLVSSASSSASKGASGVADDLGKGVQGAKEKVKYKWTTGQKWAVFGGTPLAMYMAWKSGSNEAAANAAMQASTQTATEQQTTAPLPPVQPPVPQGQWADPTLPPAPPPGTPPLPPGTAPPQSQAIYDPRTGQYYVQKRSAEDRVTEDLEKRRIRQDVNSAETQGDSHSSPVKT